MIVERPFTDEDLHFPVASVEGLPAEEAFAVETARFIAALVELAGPDPALWATRLRALGRRIPALPPWADDYAPEVDPPLPF